MERDDVDRIVAAILTASRTHGMTLTPKDMAVQYVQHLKALRQQNALIGDTAKSKDEN